MTVQKALLILFIIAASSATEVLTWGFNTEPNWNTNSPDNFFQNDTQFTDISGFPIDGVFQAGATTGDSVWTGLEMARVANSVYDFTYTIVADIYIQSLSVYSQLFIGFTDSTRIVPINNSLANGVGISIGRNYDGHLIGAHFSSSGETSSEIITQNGIINHSCTYRFSFFYNGYGWLLNVIKLPENDLIHSAYGYFNSPILCTHFTIGNKGFNSDYGNGIANLKVLIDSLYIKRDSTQVATKTENNFSDPNPDTYSISLFPNPYKTEASLLIITSGAIKTTHQIKMFSPNGACVFSFTDKLKNFLGEKRASIKINTATIPAGAYFIRMSDDKLSKTIPVLILR